MARSSRIGSDVGRDHFVMPSEIIALLRVM
jgi:hypothetical protein